jgi:hypothetical protein
VGDPGKNNRLVRSGERLSPSQGFEFVIAHQEQYPVTTMCRVLEVSTSGYYAWLKRSPSRRTQEDQVLTQRIKRIHDRSKTPTVHCGSMPNWLEKGFMWGASGWRG